jgi:hypothetical protein
MIGEVDGHKNAFIPLVGWESVEVHGAYHHTKHFRDMRTILLNPAGNMLIMDILLLGSAALVIVLKAVT